MSLRFNLSERFPQKGNLWTPEKGFMFGDSQQAGAGTNSHIQLFNPAASSVRVICYQVLPTTSATVLVKLLSHTAELASEIGFGKSLRLGQANSVAVLAKQNNATVIGTQLGVIGMDTGKPFILPVWVMLDPGFGLIVANNNQNSDIHCSFWWLEFPLS